MMPQRRSHTSRPGQRGPTTVEMLRMELIAYIDTGAGSLFIEAVIATILVVPFFLRSQIRRDVGVDGVARRRVDATGPRRGRRTPSRADGPALVSTVT